MFKRRHFQQDETLGKNAKFCWHLQLAGGGWAEGAGDSCIVQLCIVPSVPSVPSLQLSQPSHSIFLSIRSFHSFRLSDPHILMSSADNIFCILLCSLDISHFISTRVLYSVCDTNPNVCRANKIRRHLCLWLVWRIAAVSVTAASVTLSRVTLLVSSLMWALLPRVSQSVTSPGRGHRTLGRAPWIKSLLPSLVASPCFLCLWCGASLPASIYHSRRPYQTNNLKLDPTIHNPCSQHLHNSWTTQCECPPQ